MLKFIIKKLIYGFLVLFGVVTVVFLLFNVKPGDPARMMGGQAPTPEIIAAIKKDLGLDLPLYQQYLLYLNDVSPVSVHNKNVPESHVYLDNEKYSYTELFEINENRVVVIKYPYLRRSYQTKKPVAEIIAEALPGTAVLAIASIILATVIGILLGILSAVYKGSFFDNFSMTFAVLGMSGPSYFMGMIIGWIGGFLWSEVTLLPALPFGFLFFGLFMGIVINKKKRQGDLQKFKVTNLLKKKSESKDEPVNLLQEKDKFSWSILAEFGIKWFFLGFVAWLLALAVNGLAGAEIIPGVRSFLELPGTGLPMSGSLYSMDDYGNEEFLDLKNLVLPALTLGIRPLAIVMQLTRSSLLDVLSQDYVRTAKAKGLSFYKVIVKHALKNALNPVITALSGWFASLLAGAVFVEMIFSWQGLGKKVFDSVVSDDLPVIIGSVLIIATFFVIINIIVDVVYGFLDPRVRVG